MISELLSTERADALAYAHHAIGNRFPTLEANTVDTIKLASLGLILKRKELSDNGVIVFAKRFEEIAEQGEDGPWLYSFPHDLLRDLADLGPERLIEVAAAWTSTEEAQLDGWTVSATTEFLKALSEFCAKAAAEGRDLFLFVSL